MPQHWKVLGGVVRVVAVAHCSLLARHLHLPLSCLVLRQRGRERNRERPSNQILLHSLRKRRKWGRQSISTWPWR